MTGEDYMVKISVITPSIRPAGLKFIHSCLQEQTFGLERIEWLIELGFPKKGYSLNKDQNKLLRRAKGELIVRYDDYMEIPKNGLARFWELYQKYPKAIFTAPKGIMDANGNIKWDWRIHGQVREIKAVEWESDWASAPRQMFYDIGGFDERLDRCWAGDNINIAQRAMMAGYKPMVDPQNKALAHDHNKLEKHPWKDSMELCGDTLAILKAEIDKGWWQLEYLSTQEK